MELDGLPLHPLVVHAVVVLGPLAALTGLGYVAVARWRWLLRWPLVALAVAVVAVSFVAVMAGEAMVEANAALGDLVHDHSEWGELLRNWSLGFLASAALAAWALGGPSALASGAGARVSRGAVGWLAVVLLTGASVGLLVLVYLAGESGARAVWGA